MEQKIGRFELLNNGQFALADIFTTDSPYWKVIDGKIYYVIWDVVAGVYIERKLIDVKMTEEEAIADNCGCYYKLLN